MSEDVPDKPIEDVSTEDSEDAVATSTEENETVLAETPKVTFRGNAYDIISMGSLASAALILFTCVTCGMGYYCLPVLSVVLGAIGVLSARQAVDVGPDQFGAVRWATTGHDTDDVIGASDVEGPNGHSGIDKGHQHREC